MMTLEITEKDDRVSFEQIHRLLYEAHSGNRKNGFHVNTAEMSPEALRDHIGEEGKCFVALDDNKLAGVTAVRIIERNRWYSKGRIADQILVGVLPPYKGMHISTALHGKAVEFARTAGVTKIELQTAYDNTKMQKACKKWGFEYVGFKAMKGLDHYTVTLCKWLSDEHPSALACRAHYHYQKYKTLLLYKPGKLPRFGHGR